MQGHYAGAARLHSLCSSSEEALHALGLRSAFVAHPESATSFGGKRQSLVLLICLCPYGAGEPRAKARKAIKVCSNLCGGRVSLGGEAAGGKNSSGELGANALAIAN